FVVIVPDVEAARGGPLFRMAGALEPRVLVGGVIDDEFGDDPDAAPVRLRHEAAEIAHRAVGGIDRTVVGYVVAIVPQRRGIEGQEPDGVYPQALDIVEPLQKAVEVPDAITIGIV